MYFFTPGTTDVTIYVRLRDSTTGLAKTGLAYNSAGASAYYTRPLAAAAAITLATQTVTGAHTDGGFVEVDATNAKGLYRLDLPDAACAVGVPFVTVSIEFDGIIEETVLVNLGAPVNMTMISDDATAAANLELATDGGSYNVGGGAVVAASVTGAVGSVTGVVGSVTGDVGGNVVGSVGSVTGHTPQTGDSFARLGAPAGASIAADIAAIEAQTDDIGAAGAGLTAVPWNAAWDAEVQSEVQDAIEANNLDHVAGTATGIPAIPSGVYLDQMMDDGTAVYDRTTDSLQAIRDRGDAAWTTGGGGSITDILNLNPVIPTSIDLAGTATVRLGLMLTNALDDLPSTAEITPGTIDIDRKAIGGTSWTSVVAAGACSEQAGMVYYDEVFDAATGYAEGDSIRATFKSQKITVSANDYEITDANGVMFQTHIRQTMRGTDSGATAAALATAQGDLDLLTGADGATLATSQPNYAPAIAGDSMVLANSAHGGAAASLALGAGATISNASGSALTLTSSGSNGSGLEAAGNGSGEGIKATGGATGDGFQATGGATSGHGLVAVAGASGNGIYTNGGGAGDGLLSRGGATGYGIRGLGGATSGAGARFGALAAASNGMEAVGGASGVGLEATEFDGKDIAAILADTNELQVDNVPGLIAALNNLSTAQVNAEVVDVLRTDTIPDSVAADGSQPTIAQAIYLALQILTEFAISGTTLTVKKPDGTTTLATFTLNDATTPTSLTRAT